MSSFFWVVKPSKIIFPMYKTIPQKEDRILLYIGYHSIPKLEYCSDGLYPKFPSKSGFQVSKVCFACSFPDTL